MIDPTPYLEISLEVHKLGVKATATLFPKCKGIGKTQEEALAKLTRSISNHVAKQLQENLTEIVTSPQYTDIIKDPFTNSKERKRVFSLNPETTPKSGSNMFLYLSSLLETVSPKQGSRHVPQAPHEDLEDIIEQALLSAGLIPGGVRPEPHQPQPSGLLFGFPLSYN